MKSTWMSFAAVTALAFVLSAPSFSAAQNTATPSVSPVADDPSEEGTRGAFLTSRPKAADSPARVPVAGNAPTSQSRRRPPAPTKQTPVKAPTTAPMPAPTAVASSEKKNPTVQKMGMGLTLFMRDANGLALRVDPAREFHKGDRVRVLLETNTDGHIYIFNTTDNGPAEMIYPDAKLDQGGNYLESHVPFEIPSSVATTEALRWFRFDEHAGTERLYFVFTREPLAGVPIEDELIKQCAESANQCAWHPTPEIWTRLQKELHTPTLVAKVQNYGKAQTSAESHAATRSIGLAQDDPEPSLVMLNASSDSGLLVVPLDMVHK